MPPALTLLLHPPLRAGWIAGSFALLWLGLVCLPLAAVTPSLDSSWCGALIHFTAHGAQFGKEIIFTHGPLSHLIAFVYSGELFTARVVWEFVSKTAFAGILTAAIVRLPAVWRLPFLAFVLLFIWADPAADALHFLVIACLTAALFIRGTDRFDLNVFAAGLLAVCSLIKFTYFLLALFLLALVLAHYATQRRLRPAAVLAGTFALSFLIAWKFANQNFESLFAYLRMSMEICIGYKEAMGTPADHTAVVVLSITAGLLALAQCALLYRDAPSSMRLYLALFFAGTTFLSWNRAFVRADDHVLSFFALLPALLLVLWTAVEVKPFAKRAGYIINVLVFALCLAGFWLQRPALITGGLSETVRRSARAWADLTRLSEVRNGLEAQLAAARQAEALPRVRAKVQGATIDVFGYEQGVTLLNDLNYTPRLVFQSYSTYTPALIAANTAFYDSERAPAYVLMKYQPIDNRYPSLEEAGVLRQIISNYTFLFEENGYALWKKTGAAAFSRGDPLPAQTITIGAETSAPRAPAIWVELDVRRSIRGMLRSALYKPPDVYLRTLNDAGETKTYRLIPSMSSSGFLLSPEMLDLAQVIGASQGRSSPSIVSFSVRVPKPDRRFFRNQITCRMFALPSLAAPEVAAHLDATAVR